MIAYNVEPIDPFYNNADDKSDETIVASCTFDFLGFSHSEGRLELKQLPGDLTSIIGTFDFIKPGNHALKIHEYGDIEYACSSVGPVFNPYGAKRGHSDDDIYLRRIGDLEQVMGRWDTSAEFKNRDDLVDLSGPNSVLGRSMVLYEREDDFDQTPHPPAVDREERLVELMGRPIACCVIGLAKGEPKVEKEPAFN